MLVAMHGSLNPPFHSILAPPAAVCGAPYCMQAINAQQITTQTKAMVVHDAAGVGRTGAFLALHIALEKFSLESKVDLFTIIKHMRTQRMSMVQTQDQLEWAYVIHASSHSACRRRLFIVCLPL